MTEDHSQTKAVDAEPRSQLILLLARLDHPVARQSFDQLSEYLNDHQENCLPILLLGEVHLAVFVRVPDRPLNAFFEYEGVYWEQPPLRELVAIINKQFMVVATPGIYMTRVSAGDADEHFANLSQLRETSLPLLLTLFGPESTVKGGLADVMTPPADYTLPLEGSFSKLSISIVQDKRLGQALSKLVTAYTHVTPRPFVMPGIRFAAASIGSQPGEWPHEEFELQVRFCGGASESHIRELHTVFGNGAPAYVSHGRQDTIVTPLKMDCPTLFGKLWKLRKELAAILDSSRALLLVGSSQKPSSLKLAESQEARQLPEPAAIRDSVTGMRQVSSRQRQSRDSGKGLPIPFHSQHCLDGIDYQARYDALNADLTQVYDTIFKVVVPGATRVRRDLPKLHIENRSVKALTIRSEASNEVAFRISLEAMFLERWGQLLIRHEAIQAAFVAALQMDLGDLADKAVRKSHLAFTGSNTESYGHVRMLSAAKPLIEYFQDASELLRTSLARNLASAVDLWDYSAITGTEVQAITFEQFSNLTWPDGEEPSTEEQESRIVRYLGARLLLYVTLDLHNHNVGPSAPDQDKFDQWFYGLLLRNAARLKLWANEAADKVAVSGSAKTRPFAHSEHRPIETRILTADLPDHLLYSFDSAGLQAVCAGIVLEWAWRKAILLLLTFIDRQPGLVSRISDCVCVPVIDDRASATEAVAADSDAVSSPFDRLRELVEAKFPWLLEPTDRYLHTAQDDTRATEGPPRALWCELGATLSESFLTALLRYPTAAEELVVGIRSSALVRSDATASPDETDWQLCAEVKASAEEFAMAAWLGYQTDCFFLDTARTSPGQRAVLQMLETHIFDLAVRHARTTCMSDIERQEVAKLQQRVDHYTIRRGRAIGGADESEKAIDKRQECIADCMRLEQIADLYRGESPEDCGRNCSEQFWAYETATPGGRSNPLVHAQFAGRCVRGGEVLFRMPDPVGVGCFAFNTAQQLLHEKPVLRLRRVAAGARWWSGSADVCLDRALMLSLELLCLGWVRARVPSIARALQSNGTTDQLFSINLSPELIDEHVVSKEAWQFCGFSDLLKETIAAINREHCTPVIEIREGYLATGPEVKGTQSLQIPHDQARWNEALHRVKHAISYPEIKIAIDDQFGNLTDSVRVQNISRASSESMYMVKIDHVVVHRLLGMDSNDDKVVEAARPRGSDFARTLATHILYCLGNARDLVLVFEGLECAAMEQVFQEICTVKVNGITSIYAQGPHTHSYCRRYLNSLRPPPS